jgi:hypothetical protein
VADWVEICRGGPLVFRAAGTPVICENRVAGGFDGDSVVGGEGWRTVVEEKLRFSSSGSNECDRLCGGLLAPGRGGKSPYFLLSILGELDFTVGLCIAWPCCRSPVGLDTGCGAGS